MTENTAKKTDTMPGKHGGRLKVGNPGNKGGTGRPTDEAKRHVEALLASPECKGALETLLKHGAMRDTNLWLKAWTAAWDKVHAKPVQAIEMDISGEIELVPRPPEYTTEQWVRLVQGRSSGSDWSRG